MHSDSLIETHFECPYCGESISTWIDSSEGDFDSIEDCSVCCRPIEIHASLIDQQVHLTVRTDSD